VELGEPCEEWFVYEAAKFLGMSYVELEEHPRKHSLMSTAFTVQTGLEDGKSAIRANLEQQGKLNGS
jgi:hypothetical protein